MAAGMLLAAEDVFAESGLAKAHVEDIARRAGVAVGTLYNYYRDRDGLLAAVLASRTDELMAELSDAVARTAGSPARAAMVDLARTYLRFVMRRPTFIRILTEGELAHLKESYPTSATIPAACWQSLREVFGQVIARGVVEGTVPDRGDDLDLWLIVGMLRGVVLRYFRVGTPCREADADRVIGVFFDGARA
jgi:AcrR family transcriptional regulator